MKISKANCGASVKPAYYMGGYMKPHTSKFGKSEESNEDAQKNGGGQQTYSKGGYSKKKKK